MVGGAIIALVWVNLDPESYERVTHPLHFAINDVAMAFFFGLAMKEIIEAGAAKHPELKVTVKRIQEARS